MTEPKIDLLLNEIISIQIYHRGKSLRTCSKKKHLTFKASESQAQTILFSGQLGGRGSE